MSVENQISELGAQVADVATVLDRLEKTVQGLGSLLARLQASQDEHAEEMRQLAGTVDDLRREVLRLAAAEEAPPPSSGPEDETPAHGRSRPPPL